MTDAEDIAQRDLMYGYKATTTFQESYHQPCRFRTSDCPDRCGHATNVYKFHLDSLQAEKGPNCSKFVTPVQEGTLHVVSEKDLGSFADLAKSLQAGDRVNLSWNHDYVTFQSGSKSPERPVVNLSKVK